MRSVQNLGVGEALAVGLAVGLFANAAPLAATALLAAAIVGLFFADEHGLQDSDPVPLVSLATVALAAIIAGPAAAISAALIWRVTVEVETRREPSRPASVSAILHFWSAPAVALLFRLDAPNLVVVGALCVALVAWMDWSVRRLADWRLDSFGARQAQDFLGAQVVVMAPLLLFPAPQTCLTAFIAIRVACVMRWPAIDDLRYLAAR